jgi:uncharacterized iron-regulated protein
MSNRAATSLPAGLGIARLLAGVAAALPGLVACALTAAGEWESPLERNHVLAGRIWDVEAERFLNGEALVARLADHEFVLLGEKHANADHHRLQARMVAELAGAGRRPAVAFEMFTADDAPALAELLADASATPEDLRAAVRWEEKGWPEWRLYAPIVDVALRERLAIVAANPPPAWTHAIRREGFAGLEPEVVADLALDRPFPPEHRRALAEQIRRAHCGYAPEKGIPHQVDLQLARDAQMAHALLDASRDAGGAGAILIAGLEHARRDRGVPAHLARQTPEARVASLGFLEVIRDHTDPAPDLAERYGESPPFDFVWFTPRVDDSDPCETFKDLLEKMRSRQHEE